MIETNELQQESKSLKPLAAMAEMDHEQVLFCNDAKTGLRAIIAVHNTVLGPSLGGTRMWSYPNESEALKDVLRLSRGMTFKSSISGLNLGGGKAVILGNSRTDKSEALMRRFGQFVDSLGGKYITAEDVGISTEDIVNVSRETKHVSGLPESMGGGGDPSPVTAYGVYMGMKAAAKYAWGSDSLKDKRIMVQGIGHVGQSLVDLIAKEGAVIAVSDIYDERIKAISETHKVEVVNPDDVYSHPMDIYSPCALGATLNDETLKKLDCDVIAGAANNQLEDEERHAAQLRENGVVYAPDFLINAGGIINCYSETLGYNRDEAYRKTEHIFDVALEVIQRAHNEDLPAHTVAQRMAQDRIDREAAKKNK